ncbi:ATP-binding protein [Brevundimonas sp. GCM10030266]|uniref:hybrid sensor histidine kinase/response regulator n=1 Tax=Brevundimonas sp. GCM10030266 TaxID=3273386 RepID=UPI003619E206
MTPASFPAPTPAAVLIVDDLEENLLALEALLRREGVEVLKALSGDEALEILLNTDVALALLDVQMPGMDGFQLAEFMRGNTRTRHIPIIFVTAGSADRQRRFRGYEAGAVDFIQKPIEPDVLRSKAEVFIDLYDYRREVVRQRDALDAHAAALTAADRRKNEFLAVLGHELRNPLMALQAGLQLLEREARADAAMVVRARMTTQVHHLSRLIEDLLDVTRIDQGKINLRLERVSVQAVLDSAVETSRPKVTAGRHSLEVEGPAEAAWIMADFTRVSQILSNLLTNAAKYTPPEGALRLATRLEADTVVFEVSDNGVGIPLELQAGIFDLYTQAPGPDGRSAEGLGIGLALVRQLVQLHKGDITVRSDGPGQGSTFTVRLPRAL